MSDVFSLTGTWDLSMDGRLLDFVEVPSSLPLAGRYVLSRSFGMPEDFAKGGRLFLCGDGLLCKGAFRLNGKLLGVAGPWVPYRFEIAPGDLKDENRLECEISELGESFGLTPGRRADGGIVRPLWLERRPENFVEDFRFVYDLDNAMQLVSCGVEVSLNGKGAKRVEASLAERNGGRVVARGEAPIVANAAKVTLDFRAPRLWSPEDPFLYVLTVRFAGEDADEVSDIVGFRKLETRGGDFVLNGKRIFLKGVCRHQFIHGFGYAVPEAETRREMALIKHFGFNFVRLVHSPHQRETARIAAELGLLVSEESGICWNDMDDPAIAEGGLACLEKLILRDRNCPSVAAWLLYNESAPKEGYIVKAATLCRELDPECLVSIADCSGKYEELKQMAEKAKLSFMGLNVYSSEAETYKKAMESFEGMPLVFTEWGGLIGQGNPRELKILCDTFVKRFHEGAPNVAGCCFWAWADYEEYSRGNLASVDGWTIEGLVDRDLKIKDDLLIMAKMCFDIDNPPMEHSPKVEIRLKTPARSERWTPLSLDSLKPVGEERLKERVSQARAHYQARVPLLRKSMVAGIPFVPRNAAGVAAPLLLGEGCEEIFIPVGREVSAVAILGHAAFLGGYPSNSTDFVFHPGNEKACAFGEIASEYHFEFEKGEKCQPLLHGIDMLRANAMCRKWKTAPLSSKMALAMQFAVNADFELHNVYLWEQVFEKPVFLKGIVWRLKDRDSIQELFAISLELIHQ